MGFGLIVRRFVMLGVRLGGLGRMMLRMGVMGVGEVGVMAGVLVRAIMMMTGGEAMVFGGLFQMIGGLVVMFCGASGVHVGSPDRMRVMAQVPDSRRR